MKKIKVSAIDGSLWELENNVVTHYHVENESGKKITQTTFITNEMANNAFKRVTNSFRGSPIGANKRRDWKQAPKFYIIAQL